MDPTPMVLLLLLGCAPERTGERSRLELVDLSERSGFSERALGHFKRGRTCAPADFDADGRLDLFVGSPQDPAVILWNDGPHDFRAQAISDYGVTYWAAAVLDLDGDGQVDIFAGTGGNETEEHDVVYLIGPDGPVAQPLTAPLAGPPDIVGDPLQTATAGARWADFDGNGTLDLFLSTNILGPGQFAQVQPQGRDRLILNDGYGTFTDVGFEAGLDLREPSFNSSVFDYDDDGDPDIFQNTLAGLNRIWRNELVETGTLSFTDATLEVSPTDGVRLIDPIVKAFSSAVGDLNNDGWLDLVVWHRGPTAPSHDMDHHLIWLNLGGERFVEVSEITGISERWHECEDVGRGVMGSQLSDIDLDGWIDMFIGNGSPDGGCRNQLWLADGVVAHEVPGWGVVDVPVYRDASERIDMPAPKAKNIPYPYRTHGACFADYDDDGRPEMAWVNGGPGWAGDWVREPNRYFDVVPKKGTHFVTVRPIGDGANVPIDPIGTRVHAQIRDGKQLRSVYRTLHGGNGFAAHNGPDLFLGLGESTELVDLEIRWPDGVTERIDSPALDTRIEVRR